MHPHNEQLVKILCCCHLFVNSWFLFLFFFLNYLTIPGMTFIQIKTFFFFVSAFVLNMSPFCGIFSISQKKYQNVNFFITNELA